MALHYVDSSKQSPARTLKLTVATFVLFCVVGVAVFNVNGSDDASVLLSGGEGLSSDSSYDNTHKTLSTAEINSDEMHDIQERFSRYAEDDMTGDLNVAATRALQRVITECRSEISRKFLRQLMSIKIKTDDLYDNVKASARHLRDSGIKASEAVIPAPEPQDESMKSIGTQMLADADTEAENDLTLASDADKGRDTTVAHAQKKFSDTITDSEKKISYDASDATLHKAAAGVQARVAGDFLDDIQKSEVLIDKKFNEARAKVLALGKIHFLKEKMGEPTKMPSLTNLGFNPSENTLEEQRRNFVHVVRKDNRELLEEETKKVVAESYKEVRVKMASDFDGIIAALKAELDELINNDLTALRRLYDNSPNVMSPMGKAAPAKAAAPAKGKAPAKAAPAKAAPAKAAPAKGKAPAKAAPAKAGSKMQKNAHTTLYETGFQELAAAPAPAPASAPAPAPAPASGGSSPGSGDTNHQANLGTTVESNSEPVIDEAAHQAVYDVEKTTREKTTLRLEAQMEEVKRQVGLLCLKVEQQTLALEAGNGSASEEYGASSALSAPAMLVALLATFVAALL